MKLKKTTALIVSFSLGAMLFAGTALADIAAKSGYDQLKDSLKLTSKNMAETFNSYTVEASAVVKDNGNVLTSESSVEKVDRQAKVSSSVSEHQDGNGQYSDQTYHSQDGNIFYNSRDDTYHVVEFSNPEEEPGYLYADVFSEDEAGDVERIVDALVGGFKDQVVVEENQDGSKTFSGALSEVQTPALINAVTSFAVKQEFSGSRPDSTLKLTEDIYVKSVAGKAVTNRDGVLENVLANAVLSGQDKDGKLHELTLDILFKLENIDKTVVEKPDLTGKTVVKETQDNSKGASSENLGKMVGTFTNDILIEQGGKFVKAGERFIEIARIDGKTVEGRYYEQFRPGFEQYADVGRDFSFKAAFDNDPYLASFEQTVQDDRGLDGISFDFDYGKIYLNGNFTLPSGLNYDQEFEIKLD